MPVGQTTILPLSEDGNRLAQPRSRVETPVWADESSICNCSVRSLIVAADGGQRSDGQPAIGLALHPVCLRFDPTHNPTHRISFFGGADHSGISARTPAP